MVRAGDRDVLIPAEGLIVGRAAECDLTLDTNGASRRHARIYVDERGAWVEDLGSTNGTLLNGERPTTGRRCADPRLRAAAQSRLGWTNAPICAQ